jgi:hypothetical protein
MGPKRGESLAARRQSYVQVAEHVTPQLFQQDLSLGISVVAARYPRYGQIAPRDSFT